MKLEHYSKTKLKKEIKEIVARYLDLKDYRIFFFGSRVNGKSNERADIDIGIEGKKPIPFDDIFKIKEDISNLPILYKIDIIDFSRAENDFKEVAKQKIEIIN